MCHLALPIRLQEIQSREIASRLHLTRLRQVLCSPVGPLPCLPISLTGGELRAPVRPAPLRPSRPRSASRATAAAPTPHRTPRRCCGPAAPPSRGCCTTPRCAASPSPLRRRRLAVVLPLRRRRLAVELRCVAVASPSSCAASPLHRRRAAAAPSPCLRAAAAAPPRSCMRLPRHPTYYP